MFKNKFVIIIGLCIVTLALLVVGAVTLHKDTFLSFSNDGYILSTTVDANDKYYFSANTKYKKNVDNNITFDDKEAKTVVVDPACFIHYSNGDISFLQKGALVNLQEITAPIISYYNVTNENIIGYDNGNYVIETNNKTVSVESFVGRISDNKYIIAGRDLSLKVADQTVEVEGDYFEVLFIEDGIVKINNENDNFQVTAQGTYFYIGDDIIINLGDGKISYDGEVKMLLSQITINGDENIDLAVNEDKNGSGDGTGGGAGGEGEGDGTGDGTGEGDGTGGDGTGTDGNGNGSSEKTDSAKIELVSANVTTTSISAKLLLNNANSVKGTLKAYLTNVSTGNEVAFTIDTKNTNEIDLKNGTFDILTSDTDTVEGAREFHLNPDTDYLLRVVSEEGANSNQYFQKIFRTKALGVSLEKMYATEDALKYKIHFDENSNVTDVYLNIQGNDTNNRKKISINDDITEVEFSGLKSNSNYSVYIDNVTISNDDGGTGITYASRYNISRIDRTLKKAPSAVGKVVNVTTDADNARFTIKLDNISDPDNSIVGYTYEVYLNDESGDKVYTVTKNVNANSGEVDDARELILNLGQMQEMSPGVSYKCRILISYNNNEMTRELSIDDGDAFSLKSIPSINWNADDFVIGKYTASGTIELIDASCTIPIMGRSCSDNNSNYQVKNTTFTLKYYVVGDEEKNAKEVKFGFDSKKLSYDFDLDMLLSNTNYVMKVYGSYYDDNNIYHENVSIGSSVYFTTAKSDNLSLVINSVNASNDTNVVNFSMHLDKGTSTEAYEEEVTSVSINLYSGAYNNVDKLIGNYTITDRGIIEDLFNNLTITNGLFTNTTILSVGSCSDNKICNRVALTNVTNNSTNTLNNAYTIEVVDVKVGEDKLVVENPVYTFVLTSSYYLDARIAANPSYKYVTVDKILKGDLSDDEIESLRKNGVTNIDELLDDTIVGLKISNNLSDLFVDSAFKYEKAVVNYIIHNSKTNMDVKVVKVDMGNKYQPGEQTIWLDLTDTADGFVRGYTYEVGYTIDFTIDSSGLTSDEDKNVVTYDNDKLHDKLSIDRQLPIFTQYISSSTIDSITYKYSMTDIDNSLYDKDIYYKYIIKSNIDGENDDARNDVVEGLEINPDGDYHSVTIPIEARSSYSWGYHKKNINGDTFGEVPMDTYTFDSEYTYGDEIGFHIINDSDNKLKIVLEDNEVNQRAIAYKVVLNASGVSEYSKVFLASKLEKYGDEPLEGETDNRSKYIAIDYANISKFMKRNITVSVYAYYDTGLVGLNQNFANGLIIKNIDNNKESYLNIYNNGSQDITTDKIESFAMGVNFFREAYNEKENTIYLYNLFMNTIKYDNNIGANYYLGDDAISGSIGIKYSLSYTNTGLVISDGSKSYSRYNMKATNMANLKTNNASYQFESITPKISVKSTNTINSFTIQMTASGIYGNDQFKKNGVLDNNIYIEVYSDADCNNKITTLLSPITVSGNDASGYTATIQDAVFENLKSDTTYYFKLFAYMNNQYTQLYDSSSTSKYIVKTYSTKTLGGSEILSRIKFDVKPVSYNDEFSSKSLTWLLNFKSIDNFKVRFELYKPDGVEEVTNDDGELVEVTKYKAVNFDGTDGVSCNATAVGSSSNGYVNGCYISIDKSNISSIKAIEQVYSFDGNDFVFGGNYYKLVVYAIPYTNGQYVEDDKVILYENDALSSYKADKNGISYDITVPTLSEAEIKYSELSSGYNDGYYVDFVPNVIDDYKVIKYGKYNISLYDDSGKIVTSCNIISNPDNNGVGTVRNLTNGCSLDVSANTINSKYRIMNLNSNTLYSIVLSYSIVGNNVENAFDKSKINDYFVYTPSSEAGIRIGTVSAQRLGDQKLSLSYSGSVNLSSIKKVGYTIQLVGGNSMYSGEIDSNNSSIFVVSGNSVVLNIDFSTSDTGFVLVKGQSYRINTQYYYDLDKEPLTETTFLDV